jgi:hemerythrin superfamily protein
MDVLTLLKEDHKAVGALLDEAVECEPGDGRLDALAQEIESALTVHAAIEEKYFYPALHDRAEEADQSVDVFEAYTEHDLIKTLIALLKSGRQPDEQFKAEVQVLGENVKHHVKEEESTIFSLARELLDGDELEELGETMEAAKDRMMSGAARNGSGRKSSAKKSTAKKSTAKKATAKKPSSPQRARAQKKRTRR